MSDDGLLQRAAEAALQTIDSVLRAGDAELDIVVIQIRANGTPEDEPSMCTASKGLEDERDLLAYMLASAALLGQKIGVALNFHQPAVDRIIRGKGRPRS